MPSVRCGETGFVLSGFELRETFEDDRVELECSNPTARVVSARGITPRGIRRRTAGWTICCNGKAHIPRPAVLPIFERVSRFVHNDSLFTEWQAAAHEEDAFLDNCAVVS